MELAHDWLVPDWPVAGNVHALLTTRNGGVSQGNYAGYSGGGLNLGDNTDDAPENVQQNKAVLRRYLPAEPTWLKQVHGTTVIRLAVTGDQAATPVADAVYTTDAKVVCAVRTADCMPVLIADRNGLVVGVAHAGWRGMAAGVIEATVDAMRTAVPQADLCAYLGPAIGPRSFEVGDDVRNTFLASDAQAAAAFEPIGQGKWWADLYLLARQRLRQVGVLHVSGGGFCTYQDQARFYSYRRHADTGRMTSCIWRA